MTNLTTKIGPAVFGRGAFAADRVDGKRVGAAKEFASHVEAVEYALRRATETGARIEIGDVLNVPIALFASTLPHLTEESLVEVATFSKTARAFAEART